MPPGCAFRRPESDDEFFGWRPWRLPRVHARTRRSSHPFFVAASMHVGWIFCPALCLTVWTSRRGQHS
eukprot:4975060-Ditylum_brightwellii.AAC.1